MSQRVDLPGGWVEFREPRSVPERLRRRVTTMAATAASVAGRLSAIDDPEVAGTVTPADIEFVLEFNDAVAMCMVSAWSFEQQVTIEGLQDLPGEIYDAIVAHGRDSVRELLPSFQVDVDPKAPSGS